MSAIRTKKEYRNALAQIERLASTGPSTLSRKGKAIQSLMDDIQAYEKRKFPTKLPSPIEAIKFRMEQRNLKQIDLVRAGCGSRSHVSEMLNLKRKITLPFIRAFHKLDSTTPLKVLIQDYEIHSS